MDLERQIKISKVNFNNPKGIIEINLTNAVRISLPALSFVRQNNVEEGKINGDFKLESTNIIFLNVAARPKTFKPYKRKQLKLLEIFKNATFIPNIHPYLNFNSEGIDYSQVEDNGFEAEWIPNIQDSERGDGLLLLENNLNLIYFDENYRICKKLNLNDYSKGYQYIRCLDFTPDLTNFVFTVIDKLYLLNRDFEILKIFEVPHEDGFEKVVSSMKQSENEIVRRSRELLDVKADSTPEEVKQAFRKKLMQFHPDKNDGSIEFEEKTKALIKAYELLSESDFNTALEDSDKEVFTWVNKKNVITTTVGNIKIEMYLGLDTGEDWIYGVGISKSSEQIYLGCYSGKLYKIDKRGNASHVYIVPKGNIDNPMRSNPIYKVIERESLLHIYTYEYVYILDNNTYINYIPCQLGRVMWFSEGFIVMLDKKISVYSNRGELFGIISFKTPIKYIAYRNNIFLVELTAKSFIFEINNHQ